SWALYRPYGWLPTAACRPQAQHAVERAMALGPGLAEVQFAQALHLLYFDPHWRRSEPYFVRALELNPRWSLARAFYGVFLARDGVPRHGREDLRASGPARRVRPHRSGARGSPRPWRVHPARLRVRHRHRPRRRPDGAARARCLHRGGNQLADDPHGPGSEP